MEIRNGGDALRAVRREGWPLKRIPVKLRDRIVCVEALKKDAGALEFVPDELKKMRMCEDAVARNPAMLQFVPEVKVTEGMCLGPCRKTAGCSGSCRQG